MTLARRRNGGSVICRDPVPVVGVCVGPLVILLIGLWVLAKGSGIRTFESGIILVGKRIIV